MSEITHTSDFRHYFKRAFVRLEGTLTYLRIIWCEVVHILIPKYIYSIYLEWPCLCT